MQEIKGNQNNPSHTKQCKACKKWLPFTEFHLNKRNKDKMNYMCKKCYNEYNKKIRTPEKARKYRLKAVYNIAQKQYDRMFADQNGVCYICKQPETVKDNTGKTRPLAVDHNHETDEIRRLLCNSCNQILGFVETNLERLGDFLGYLEEMKSIEPELKIIQLPLLE